MMLRLSAVYALESRAQFDVVVRGPFEKVLKTLRDLGYEGVELNIPNPFRVDVRELRRAVEGHGLEVSAISTGLSYVEYGYSLSSLDPEPRRRSIEFFKRYLELSAELGARKVVVGLARGRCRDDECPEARRRLVEALEELDDYAGSVGSTLVIEPLNRYETNLINTLSEAITIVRRLRNARVLLDTFHAMLEEDSVYNAITRAAGYIGHVHFADSNRRAPGLGMLDWERIVLRLVKAGYRGFVSIESRPDGMSFEDMLRVAAETLREVLI